ncbi:type I restriction enzyme endonuclease domain-containing protein [Glaciibacter flavus]|uniref:type I restriction enzyme endonuclease domain-containing protein n=1 Tax=Orlajensenia flava TaxID=2565934 RepID=UPI003B00C205
MGALRARGLWVTRRRDRVQGRHRSERHGGPGFGDEPLTTIARDLVRAVRESATIDWNLKDSVRTTMRSEVRRLLAGYDYPLTRGPGRSSRCSSMRSCSPRGSRDRTVPARVPKRLPRAAHPNFDRLVGAHA